jgi:hypothetical protein
MREIDPADRVAYCKDDFEMAVRSLRQMPFVLNQKLNAELIRILQTYFNLVSLT